MADVDSEELFAKTPVGRLFLRAAIPGALGMLASMLYDQLDGILVGVFLGETAFAAINLAMPFVIVAFAVGDLVGSGSSVPIAIHLGKGNEQRANEIFTGACLMNVVSGTLIGLAFFLAAPAIMAAMGATGKLAETATTFWRVYALFLPLNTNLYAVDNFLRISGQIRRSLLVNVFMAIFGGVLEAMLLGVARFGIWAAALAYCLAMTSALLTAFLPFVQGKLTLRFSEPRVDAAMVGEVVRCGLPVFIENVSGRVFSIVMNVLLLRLGGETAVSAYGLLFFSAGFVMPLLYGAVDAMQPAVGYNWGAGNLDRVRALEVLCLATSALLSLGFVVVTRVFPEQLTLLFIPTASPEFIELTTHALHLFGLAYFVRWISLATQEYMIAVGQTRLATFVSMVMAFVAPMAALGILLPLGLDGLWLNMPLASCITAVACILVLLRFRRTAHERVARA